MDPLFAIGSQVARIAFGQLLDDDYVAMSAVTLVFLAGVVVILARAGTLAWSHPTPGEAPAGAHRNVEGETLSPYVHPGSGHGPEIGTS